MGAGTGSQNQMLPDEAVEWLLTMPSVLRSVCLDGSVGVRDLEPLVDAARIAQSALGGFVTRVGLVGRHVEPGSSVELLQGRARSVRSGTARRDAQRVEAAVEFDLFTDGAASGRIGGDQLDSLARAARRLDDGEREALNTPEPPPTCRQTSLTVGSKPRSSGLSATTGCPTLSRPVIAASSPTGSTRHRAWASSEANSTLNATKYCTPLLIVKSRRWRPPPRARPNNMNIWPRQLSLAWSRDPDAHRPVGHRR